MVRNLLLTFALLFVGVMAYAQTSMSGKVTNKDDNAPIEFAIVKLIRNGIIVTGAEADLDGNYRISSIDAGTYEVEFSSSGFTSQKVTGVSIIGGRDNILNAQLSATSELLQAVDIIEYTKPLFQKDNTTTGGIVTAAEIAKLPNKSINGLVATTAGTSSVDGGGISIKGGRSSGTVYILDGVRVNNSRLIPVNDIEQLEVVTGGISAQYGDATGGLILATSKGPASQFGGGLELETSQFLDPYGYNFANLNLSGPIIRKKETKETLLGFRISGQYIRNQEDNPPALSVYRAKDEVIAALEANPLTTNNGINRNTAETLRLSDINVLDARPYEASSNLDLTAKLDARITRQLNITLSGSYYDGSNQFTPGIGGNDDWSLLNSHHNPTDYNNTYRVNFRIRHRLGNDGYGAASGSEKNTNTIRNASYTLLAGFERNSGSTSDPRHQDRLFDYGYTGKATNEYMPLFGPSLWSGAAEYEGIANIGYQEIPTGFSAGFPSADATASYNPNPILAAYNQNSINEPLLRNGFIPTLYRRPWDLYRNVGAVYDSYNKRESDLISGEANFSFDIYPKGSDKNAHSIQFGLLYEQRVNNSYNVAPYGLWEVARLQQNRNIVGIDTSTIKGWYQDPPVFVGGVPVDSIPVFANLTTNNLGDLQFYKSIRELTGTAYNDYVNVDAVDPRALKLDMFSAQELNDQALLGYYGYDYLGNKLPSTITFNDFFTAKDAATNIRTFPVGAFKPSYQAGFIQDKFQINDVYFRVGLRVDRYDANTKVLKDPYSLYPAVNAKDFYESIGQEKPSNIGDDYAVYVTGANSNTVKAYRKDDQWFLANGVRASDGNVIFGGGLVYPKYQEQDATKRDVRSRDFDPNSTFADYEAQVNFSPRLSFSFPISEIANFFAHYDVLVQRPTSNILVTALDYFYWEDAGRFTDNVRNNANLKPQRTIDYEVGFKQKLNNTSALSVSAYYREMRDMIQRRTYFYLPAPLNSYRTYGNLDFGTSKGFIFTYDLRRTNNVQATVNYTLQFADGTGSNANSQGGVADRGNLRTLFPLDFDERHSFNVTLDYRYANGKAYNGPKWFGVDVLADAGINVQAIAVSGRPYTATFDPDKFGGSGTIGSLNGARKPWRFTVDMRIDKSFNLTKPDAKHPMDLNVYLRVQNVLDARNVANVYSTTGSPTDDGYLNSVKGENAISDINKSGRDLNSFLDYYNWRLLNPDNYFLPRRIFLGMTFGF